MFQITNLQWGIYMLTRVNLALNASDVRLKLVRSSELPLRNLVLILLLQCSGQSPCHNCLGRGVERSYRGESNGSGKRKRKTSPSNPNRYGSSVVPTPRRMNVYSKANSHQDSALFLHPMPPSLHRMTLHCSSNNLKDCSKGWIP